ncbi:MAG: hypothetical protein QXK89_08340 [Candidatus Bathyarchaeia archaeon]
MSVKSLRFVAAALLAVLLVSVVAQAFPMAPASAGDDGRERAEAVVNAASKAGERVVTFVEAIKANSTLIELINGSSLKDAFWGNVSRIEYGMTLLNDAKEDLEGGDYTDAINEATDAMGIFKDVWVNIHRILCALGVTEAMAWGKPEVQAQGLLVAANRSLERIERIRSLMGEAEALLKDAELLLNVTAIRELLAEGNVSGAAHMLAEANNLIALAYKTLKASAEAKMAERMERFRVRIMERLEAMVGKLDEKDVEEILEEMGIGFRNMGQFRRWLNNLLNETRGHIEAGERGYALGKLKKFDEGFKGFARRFVAKTVPPEAQEENPALEVSVEKQSLGRNQVILSVKVENTGDCEVVFPNAALGLVIEKEVNGEWKPSYTPASAQVLVKLEQGESKEITVRITKPEEGTYRATVSGWSKITLKPVSASSAEFNLP